MHKNTRIFLPVGFNDGRGVKSGMKEIWEEKKKKDMINKRPLSLFAYGLMPKTKCMVIIAWRVKTYVLTAK